MIAPVARARSGCIILIAHQDYQSIVGRKVLCQDHGLEGCGSF